MATPDAATMGSGSSQGKAMPLRVSPPAASRSQRRDLDNAIQAVGRVPAEGRPVVRKFIMAGRPLGCQPHP